MLTIAFVMSALSLAAFASPSPFDVDRRDAISIALSRRDSPLEGSDLGVVDPLALLAGLLRTFFKYENGFAAYEANTGEPHPLADSFSPWPTANLTRRATSSAGNPLVDDDGDLWQGAISVGTPPVTYTVDFDTGSSDLFLPGPSCTTNCKGHKKYQPSSSSTSADARQKFSLAYGDGSTVQGQQYTDTVSISGLTATKQRLGAASTYSDGFSSTQFPPDGLMGMAYQSISNYNAAPFFQSLVAQKQVSSPVFAFKLASSGSELYLGGTNTNLYSGSITYTPVTKQGYWQVALQGVSVNGASVLGSAQSIIDTGTTLVVAPTAQAKALYAAIPGSKDASKTIGDGFYTFPCSASQTVSLTFGGKSFPISPQFFNLGRVKKGSSDCIGSIVGADYGFWIVGDVFLQNVYSVFDLGSNRVGFATLKK